MRTDGGSGAGAGVPSSPFVALTTGDASACSRAASARRRAVIAAASSSRTESVPEPSVSMAWKRCSAWSETWCMSKRTGLCGASSPKKWGSPRRNESRISRHIQLEPMSWGTTTATAMSVPSVMPKTSHAVCERTESSASDISSTA